MKPYARVYLAGSSRELDRVRRVAASLESAGVEIECRWWETVEADIASGGFDRAAIAREEVLAIRRADAMLVLASPHRSDSYVEMGLGMSHAYSVHVAHPDASVRGIFASLCFEHESDEAAVNAIVEEIAG